MKIWIILVFTIVITMGLYSCHCDGCAQYGYDFYVEFFGFSDTDVTPVILKSYVKGSNFSNFLDSTIYTNAANTTASYNNLANGYFITAQGNDSTDYMVSLPKAGLSYLITNMDFPLQKSGCGGCAREFQIPTLSSCSLNGVPITNISGENVMINK
jgi:hypothetical protein